MEKTNNESTLFTPCPNCGQNPQPTKEDGHCGKCGAWLLVARKGELSKQIKKDKPEMPTVEIIADDIIKKEISELIDNAMKYCEKEVLSIVEKENEDYVKICENFKKSIIVEKSIDRLETIKQNAINEIKDVQTKSCMTCLKLGLNAGFKAANEWRDK